MSSHLSNGTATPLRSNSSDLGQPVVSEVKMLGNLVLPPFFGWVFSGAIALLVSGGGLFSRPRLLRGLLGPFEWFLNPGNTPIAFFMVFMGFTALLIIALHVKRVRRTPEFRVYSDGIESLLNGDLLYRILWNDIERVPAADHEVRIFSRQSRKSSRDYFHFASVNGRTLDLPVNFHLGGSILPFFVNTKRLQQALLVSLLKARPDLRVAGNVYSLCNLHPATLEIDNRSKVSERIVGLSLTVSLMVPLLLYFSSWTTWQWTLGIALALWALSFGLWRWATRFDIDPEKPEIRASRLQRLSGLPH
jgi:hypothetical protein